MTPERALEIIAAHGADSGRWPDADRAAVLALATADAGVASALREAATLDALIAGWAHDVAPRSFDVAAITALPQDAPAIATGNAWRLRWLGGGALAAAFAAGLIIFAPLRPTADTAVATLSPTTSVPSATADGNVDGRDADALATALGGDAEAFNNVFTPTPDEEQLI